jgi:hypothetical protein
MRALAREGGEVVGARLVAALALAAALASAQGAGAEEWNFLGSRCQAMGGACVAVEDGASAAYWNPGALAFASSYDIQIPAGATLTATDDVFRDLDRVFEFVDDNDVLDILDKVQDGVALTPSELQTLLGLVLNELPELQGDQGFVGSLETGLLTRWGRVALTGIGLGFFGATPIFDLTGLSLSSAGTAADRIDDVVGPGNDRSGQLTTEGQSLADLIAASTAFTQNQAEELVFQAEQAGVDAGDPRIQEIVSGVAAATADPGSGDLSDNLSGAFVQGLVTQEVGLSGGVPVAKLPFLGAVPLLDRVGIGGNVKYMHGISYFRAIRYQDATDVGDLVDDLLSFENTRNDDTWGIDLGLLVKPTDWLRVGVVGRNLNSPSFEVAVPDALRGAPAAILGSGPGSDFVLEPQARAGVALMPFSIWTIAADIDLTENESEALHGYRSRLFSLGTEFQIPFWKLGIAPRAGLYLNTASGFAHDPVITFGLGLKFWRFVLDVAGGISTKRVAFEPGSGTDHVPSRLNLSAALKWVQRF